jgi:hypothetical protein
MNFEEDGIRFAPLVADRFSAISMRGINYRHCVLNVKLLGHGARIASFKMDGNTLEKPFFDAALTGEHEIEILLQD